MSCSKPDPAPPSPPVSGSKAINSFAFKAARNTPNLSIDVEGTIVGDSIKFTLPSSVNLSSLVPTIIHTGQTIAPASDIAQNFTSPVSYTVKAADGTNKTYTIAARTLSNTKSITSFAFMKADNPGLSSDCNAVFSNDSIYITVPYATDITALRPLIVHTGASVNPATLEARDYSSSVTYGVTAEDASIKNYIVVVKVTAPAAILLINSTNSNGSGNGAINALDAHTGQLRWKHTSAFEAILSANTYEAGVIYTGIGNKITAFDTVTKTVKWEYTTGGILYSTPMLANGIVYINCDDLYLYAINASDGSLKWRFAQQVTQSQGGNYSSPVVVNGVVYFASIDQHIYAVDALTGQLKWKTFNTHGGGADFQSSPCVVNGVLYVGDSYRNLLAVNISDGSFKWKYQAGSIIYSSPTVANNVVYVCSGDNSLYAIDAVTGLQKWKFTTPISIYGSPYVADGAVYFGTEGPNANLFYAVNEADGTLKWSYYHSSEFHSSPIVYNDVVYVGSYGYVLAFNKNTGAVKWIYPAGSFQDMRSSPIIIDQLNNKVMPSISGHRQ